MKIKNFFKSFFEITNLDIVTKYHRKDFERYGGLDKSNRKKSLILNYVILLVILIAGIVFYNNFPYVLFEYLCIFPIIIYFLAKTYRFGIVFYIISYYAYNHDNSPCKKILKNYCYSSKGHEHIIDEESGRVYALERKTSRSLLKMRYRAFEKGRHNSVRVIIKRNQFILTRKKKKIIIKDKNRGFDEFIKLAIKNIILLSDIK